MTNDDNDELSRLIGHKVNMEINFDSLETFTGSVFISGANFSGTDVSL